MWSKLPIWFRAILIGLIVSGLPTFIWAALAGVNIRTTPQFPWSALAMAGVLFAYWRYAGGDGPPRSTAEYRREHLRAKPLTPSQWRLALIAGGSGVAALWALFAALRGVMHIAAAGNDTSHFPIVTIILLIVMGSAVAGVAEEAGFRGYMQLSLERAYGPVIAIGTTSVIFTLIHLTHGPAVLPFLPFFFVVAVVYSLLTLITGSIFPSMTLHFVGDVMLFALRFAAAREGAAGETGHIALIPLIACAALAALSVLSFRLLSRQFAVAAV